MRYTIHNISHRSHPLDEHYVDFHFDVHFTEPEERRVKNYFYGYGQLMHYLRKNYPDFAKYLESVRTSIDAWGPCEHRIMQEMGDEALEQLYQYLEEYLLQADWIPQLFEMEKIRRSQPPQQQINTQKAAEKVFTDLDSHRISMQFSQRKYYKFCETVEKQIRQTAVEVYPELMECNPEQIKEFKYLFVSEIQAMQSKIEKHLLKSREK